MENPATATATPDAAGSAPPARRRRWWAYMPLALIAAVAAAVLYAVVRGSWADTTAKAPESSAAGAVVQLYQQPGGNKQVRCALLVDHPMPAVWAVVTDYDRHSKIFPYVTSSKATREPDGRWRLEGVASSTAYGDWPFTTRITHVETADRCSATWDEAGGGLAVNRGGWTLTPAGSGKTLVVFAMEVEVDHCPNFFVRTVLLHRVGAFITALGRWPEPLTALRTPPSVSHLTRPKCA